MDLASKKVLIFGIDGFTGQHLKSFLESEYEVYGTSYSLSTDLKNRLFQVDITYKNDIEKVLSNIQPEYIIVLSGISFPAHGHNEDFYNINTIGAINILESIIKLELKPQKIILVSSATVYGNQGIEVLDESLCPMPSNHYGASKYAMESIAKNYFDKLPIIITRPFNYTGIGQDENFLIPKIVSHYKQKKEIIQLGNLDVSREFNSIDFVCEVYKRLINIKNNSEIVNIASNKGIRLLDVIDMMNQIAKYNIKVEVNPAFVRKGEIKSLTGSNKRLFNLIGYVKQKDFKEVLKQMYEA